MFFMVAEPTTIGRPFRKEKQSQEGRNQQAPMRMMPANTSKTTVDLTWCWQDSLLQNSARWSPTPTENMAIHRHDNCT